MTIYTDPFAHRILLAELQPYDVNAAATTTVYMASEYYITEPSDSPANQLYYGVIEGDVFFQREMFAGDKAGGATSVDRGLLTIINTKEPGGSSRFDAWLDPDQYTWEGRTATLYLIEKGAAHSTKTQIYSGKLSGIDYQKNRIMFKLKSNAYLLDTLLQNNRFAGTGGDEGGSELTGLPKPVCFGRCRNVEPVTLDASNLVYQLHDGEIQEIEAVRDKGVALTLDATVGTGGDVGDYATLAAASIGSGKYATCLAEGLIATGSIPTGRITVDVKGSTLGGTYSATAGDIMAYVVQTYTNLSSIDSAALAALDTAFPYDMGYYNSIQDVNVLDVLDVLKDSYGGWYGINRAGAFDAGLFTVPATAALDIAESDIEDDSMTREPVMQVAYRVKVNYRKNWAVQTGDELAGSVGESDRALYSKEYLGTTAEDTGTLTKYPEAVEYVMDTALYDSAGAAALASRDLTLRKQRRSRFTMTTNIAPLQVTVNDTVNITHSRFGLSGGQDFVVLRLTEYYLAARVELSVFG